MTDRKRTTQKQEQKGPITHEGTYRTRIEWSRGGTITLVQYNKHGGCDCVILPPDLARALEWT